MARSVQRRATWSPKAVFYAAVAVAVVALVGLSAIGILPSSGSPVAGGRGGLGASPSVAPAPGLEGIGRRPPARPRSQPTTVAQASDSPAPQPTPIMSAAPTPTTDQWRFADLSGPELGSPTAKLVRYRVAVESVLPITVVDFTGTVDATLGDPRSWIAGGDIRLQRVAAEAGYDFTIYLASPNTAYQLCLASGVDIRVGADKYTSCRSGDNVVINSDRYQYGIAAYAGHQAEYRQYVVNHEVGHQLGHGHELCPGPGQPAPVMQQQTLDMQGCTPNSWPYPAGIRYSGPPSTAT